MDNWRTVDIQDAIVSIPGPTGLDNFLINPLEVIARSRMLDLTVHGTIESPTSFKRNKRLEHDSEASKSVTIQAPLFYSIGIDPVSLWFGADSTWYSIYLADIYNEIWLSISAIISIYFHVVDYYGEDTTRLDLPLTDQVLEVLVRVRKSSRTSLCINTH